MQEEGINHSNVELSLEERMSLAQQGDKIAYESLLREITFVLRSYLAHSIGPVPGVEGMLQTILESIHHARHTYDASRPLRPWIFAIAKYRINEHMRALQCEAEPVPVQPVQDAVEPAVSVPDAVSALSAEEQAIEQKITEIQTRYEDAYQLLLALPDTQKKVMELTVAGHSRKDVAKQLKISETAVKISTRRTYKMLQEKMSKAG